MLNATGQYTSFWQHQPMLGLLSTSQSFMQAPVGISPATGFRTSAGGVFSSEALQISAAGTRLLVIRAMELLHGSR